MAGTRAKGARKDASSLWAGHCYHAAVCRQRLTAHGSDPSYPVMYGAEVWDTTKAVKDKMSAVD
jgi:hypothetical protein